MKFISYNKNIYVFFIDERKFVNTFSNAAFTEESDKFFYFKILAHNLYYIILYYNEIIIIQIINKKKIRIICSILPF